MRRTTSIFQFMLAVIILVSTGGCSLFQKDERPNIFIIVTDDQRLDTMEYMPETQSQIFDQGVIFKNGFVTTPLCCPSRASILTGMYAHNHNVRENEDKLKYTTFMEVLHRNGYYTGLVGKYLNSWKGEARPEYDYWVSYANGETRYYNPRLNINGEWKRLQGQYVTYALGDYAIDFLNKATKQRKPFVLLFTPNAPHLPSTPAKEDEGLLQDLPPSRPPSFNEADISDKPAWLANRPLLGENDIKAVDAHRRDALLTLISLDRTIGKIMTTLKDSGELDNTLIIFLSDNGEFWGEHRFNNVKNRYYEENVHVPFAIRYPPLVPTPYTENKLVANIDIAPTVFDLAGIPIPDSMDGASMLNLLKHEGTWRDYLLLEGGVRDGSYVGVRSERYFYGENDTNPEFYDLQKDPFQLENLINQPEYKDLIAQYKTIMDKMAQTKVVPTVTP
jgi:N-acetylglucosamine-6-sulfatase